jgi:hypothetical protein
MHIYVFLQYYISEIVGNNTQIIVAISLNTLFKAFIICHSEVQKADKNSFYFKLNNKQHATRLLIF